MGGPEAQAGTLRGELEIGPKFGPPGPPWASQRSPISQHNGHVSNIFGHDL